MNDTYCVITELSKGVTRIYNYSKMCEMITGGLEDVMDIHGRKRKQCEEEGGFLEAIAMKSLS